MYLYQAHNRYFAQVADDVKGLAEQELDELGATGTRQTYRGIHFNAAPAGMYAINYQSRLINRVLAPLASFGCHSDNVLYKKAGQISWEDFLNPDRTFAIFASVSHSSIRHSRYAALRLKDAVVDYFRNATGKRPSVDTRNPDLWINLHIQNNEATISVDTSGGSLHRRGYRSKSVDAPMVETLAAAIIRLSGWDGQTPLTDPFCGSGTLLCEAFMRAAQMPAAFLRRNFGFEHLPDFDMDTWIRVKNAADQSIFKPPKDLITGSDISSEAVIAARSNLAKLHAEDTIGIKQCNIFDIESLQEKTIVCNPPYGIRTGKNGDLADFYKQLGDFLKQRCASSTAYIYFGQREHIKNIGLRASWKKPLANGGLDGRLVKFELY